MKKRFDVEMYSKFFNKNVIKLKIISNYMNDKLELLWRF